MMQTQGPDAHRAQNLAHGLLFLMPLGLLGGAFAFEHIGGLYPCEMCIWQRWPHGAALALALLAFVVSAANRRPLLWLAAFSILVTGAIGVFHAGVELQWWEGLTQCTSDSISLSGAGLSQDIFAAPIVRCDAIAWSLFGISMAGYNALLSLLTAGASTWLLLRK